MQYLLSAILLTEHAIIATTNNGATQQTTFTLGSGYFAITIYVCLNSHIF